MSNWYHGAAHVGEVEGVIPAEHVDGDDRAEKVEHADQRDHVPHRREA